MPRPTTEEEKVAMRKVLHFAVAIAMKALSSPPADEARDNERIFYSAELFVKEA